MASALDILVNAMDGPRKVYRELKIRRDQARYGYFFVRAHPRSGTTWVERLLNQHPRVHSRGEFHFQIFEQALEDFGHADHQMGRRGAVKEQALQCVREMCVRLLHAGVDGDTFPRGGKVWLGDRTPMPVKIRDAELLPGARYFNVVRDGRDVLVSFTFHELNGSGYQMKREPFRSRMAPMVERFRAEPDHFVEHPEALLADEQWVRFASGLWAERVGEDLDATESINRGGEAPRAMVVRYERVHADARHERDEMLRFLGLDPSEAQAVDAGEFTSAGFEKENPTSFRRRGEVGQWQKYFTGEVARWFDEVAGEVQERLGYPRMLETAA